MSQLDLALATNISQKHLSFVELGRARPSREMVLRLAVGLELPLRARNDLLLSAGYAPVYAERPLDERALRSARAALEMMLAHHEPYPAIVMDAAWNIVMRNRAAGMLIAHCAADAAGSGTNFMRLMFSDTGLRPRIRNWPAIRAALLGRMRKEATANPASPSARLLAELDSPPGHGPRPAPPDTEGPLEPVESLELRVGDSRIKLFSTFATFGLPQDITLQELRIDFSFPADEETRQFFLDAAARA